MRSVEHYCGRRIWFCSMVCSSVTVGDHFPNIIFSLVKQKVSGEQEQEQVFVAMEFTAQVNTFC